MSKTVKTIATVAAVAAAAYYGGPYIASTMGASSGAAAPTTAAAFESSMGLTSAYTAGTTAAIGTKTAAAGGSLLSAKAIQGAGAGIQLVSGGMQMLASSKAGDAAKEQERIQAKMNEAEAQKARIQTIRQQRILAGRTEASAASRGFSPSGTSSIVTGLGSLNTQTSTAIADIAGRKEYANAIGSTQTEMYSAMNSAQGWQSFSNLGTTLVNKDVAGSISSNFGNIFSRGAA